MKSFFAELKRRNVYKVAVAYLVVSWLLIQAASILFPTFDLPAWAMKAFVVVLVLLLKTFLAEAFVIPTGSMAETLLGYNREVTCGETNTKGELVKGCGYHFLVNASKEGDPTERDRRSLIGCKCPNCGYLNKLTPFRFERAGGANPGGVIPNGGNP